MAIPTGRGSFADTPVEDSLFATTAQVIAPLFAPLGFDSWQAGGALVTGLIAKEVVVSTLAQVYGADLPAAGAVDEAAADGADVAAADGASVAAAGEAMVLTAGGANVAAAQSSALLSDLRFIGASFVDATVDTVKAIPLLVGVNLFETEAAAPPSALMTAIRADFARSSGGYPVPAGLAFMVFVLLYTPCMVAVAAARHEFGRRWMWTSVLGQFAVAWLVALAVFQVGKLLVG